MVKSEMIGIRIPSDLLSKVDRLKEKEESDRTTVILNALRYWTSVDGKVTGDSEYLNVLKKASSDLDKVLSNKEEIEKLHNIISEQQNTISTLLRLIPRNE